MSGKQVIIIAFRISAGVDMSRTIDCILSQPTCLREEIVADASKREKFLDEVMKLCPSMKTIEKDAVRIVLKHFLLSIPTRGTRVSRTQFFWLVLFTNFLLPDALKVYLKTLDVPAEQYGWLVRRMPSQLLDSIKRDKVVIVSVKCEDILCAIQEVYGESVEKYMLSM